MTLTDSKYEGNIRTYKITSGWLPTQHFNSCLEFLHFRRTFQMGKYTVLLDENLVPHFDLAGNVILNVSFPLGHSTG